MDPAPPPPYNWKQRLAVKFLAFLRWLSLPFQDYVHGGSKGYTTYYAAPKEILRDAQKIRAEQDEWDKAFEEAPDQMAEAELWRMQLPLMPEDRAPDDRGFSVEGQIDLVRRMSRYSLQYNAHPPAPTTTPLASTYGEYMGHDVTEEYNGELECRCGEKHWTLAEFSPVCTLREPHGESYSEDEYEDHAVPE